MPHLRAFFCRECREHFLREAAGHGDGFYEAAVSPTTFRDLWKGAMGVSRECNAVNSLTDACFVQVLFYYT